MSIANFHQNGGELNTNNRINADWTRFTRYASKRRSGQGEGGQEQGHSPEAYKRHRRAKMDVLHGSPHVANSNEHRGIQVVEVALADSRW